MRKLSNAAHGHIIWSTDGISSHHQNIMAHIICHIKHIKSKRLSNTVQFQHKRITNPSFTHTQQNNASTGWMHQSHPRNDEQSQELSSCTGLTMYHWCNTGSRTNKSPPIWRNHYPRLYLQHTKSSEGAGTSKHSHTPYQWQQTNHVVHATAGTNSEGAHRHSYSQTNQHALHCNHHRIKQQTHHISGRVVQMQTPSLAASITTMQCRYSTQAQPHA